MKTPITYYGGKQNLAQDIIKMFPDHDHYVEPFFGGGAVFFAKEPSRVESINDIDDRVVNFWKTLQDNPSELLQMVEDTLHSETLNKAANKVFKQGHEDKVFKAWAFWMACNSSFRGQAGNGFLYSVTTPVSGNFYSKQARLREAVKGRLRSVQIFNRDAIELVKTFDKPGVFVYLDPPYPEGYCGHYEEHKGAYYKLLDVLPTLEHAQWLMSSYPSEQLDTMRLKHGWSSRDKTMSLAFFHGNSAGETKTECLTWNYKLKSAQPDLFDNMEQETGK